MLTRIIYFLSYHMKVNDRWEICVSLSDGQFQQVPRSFEAKGIMSQLKLQLWETYMVFWFVGDLHVFLVF